MPVWPLLNAWPQQCTAPVLPRRASVGRSTDRLHPTTTLLHALPVARLTPAHFASRMRCSTPATAACHASARSRLSKPSCRDV